MLRIGTILKIWKIRHILIQTTILKRPWTLAVLY